MKNKIKRHCVLYIALLLTSFSFAQIPTYYAGFDVNKAGEDLKNDLALLITSTHVTNLTYTPGVWDALQQTDLDPTNENNVLLIYGYSDSDNNYVTDRTRSKDFNGGNLGDWNREHTYPRSLGDPNLGSTGPGSDAHHLRASDVTLNSNRGNLTYGAGTGNAAVVNGSWYPGDEWKGDVARMMMYMYLRYGTQCLPSAVGTGTQNYSSDMMDLFLEWNTEDPVSQYEINRNVLLEGIQGNRNPFIDNPAFATSVWGGPEAEDRFNTVTVVDTEAPTAPLDLISSNITATSSTVSWSAATDNVGVLAYQIFNGETQIGSTTETSFYIDELTASTAYTFTVKAIDAASNTSDDSTITITTSEETIIVSSSIIINEVDVDTAGTDVLEFVELYDGGVGNTSLDGLVLVFYNGSNDLSYASYDLDGQTTNANGYFVVGNVDVPNVSSITFASNGLQNGADAVALYTGNSTDFPNSSIVTTDSLVDAFVYGTNDADDTELLVLLNDGESQINEDEALDKDVHSSQRIPNGTGGNRNTSTYVQLTPTPGEQNGGDIVVVTPTILINEVDADTAGTDVLEFVELYDGGVGNTSLDGLVLVFYNGSNDLSYGAYDLDGQTTDENGYFVVGNVDVPNVSSITFASNGLQNGADAVALYTGDDIDFPTSSIVTTDNLIDAFVYDTNDADDVELGVLLNTGEVQINED